MCSDRIPDGIERTPDRTFSRYNPNHPAEGGCRKDSGGKSPLELRQEVTARRKLVADTQNEMLAECGYSTRVDHRSLRDQGLNRRAERHLGPLLVKEMADGEKDQYVAYRAGHDASTPPALS
ncbi:MobA/MobL family protein [Stenotrophomonas maltophilia]|nr:MobA/MobL family protein [Stenotrophomonas maltophilia]